MKRLLQAILLYLKGFCMGVADIIPGVSGGTIALITGIYNDLVYSISQVNAIFIIDFFKRDTESTKKNFRRVDFMFFIPLGLGIGTAFLIFSRIITQMLDTYTALTYAFFFGLILASSYFVYKKIRNINFQTVTAFTVGFLFAFLFIGLGVKYSFGHSPPIILLSGAIAICAMILPGISGAFLLLFLGQYEHLLNAIHTMDIMTILTFSAGAGIGIILFSRLLNHLLSNRKSQTMAFLTGLMLGSLRLPFQRITETIPSIFPIFLAGASGFIMVIILEAVFRKK